VNRIIAINPEHPMRRADPFNSPYTAYAARTCRSTPSWRD
jgi:hypothetical protein